MSVFNGHKVRISVWTIAKRDGTLKSSNKLGYLRTDKVVKNTVGSERIVRLTSNKFDSYTTFRVEDVFNFNNTLSFHSIPTLIGESGSHLTIGYGNEMVSLNASVERNVGKPYWSPVDGIGTHLKYDRDYTCTNRGSVAFRTITYLVQTAIDAWSGEEVPLSSWLDSTGLTIVGRVRSDIRLGAHGRTIESGQLRMGILGNAQAVFFRFERV